MKQEWFLPEQNFERKVLYKNARIIDPETKKDIIGDLLTIGDKIADIGNIENVVADEIIDCSGKLIVPGLVDIQVHFRDPGQTQKEDITSGSKAAAAGGITTVVCQPNTSPVIDNVDILDLFHYRAKEKSYINLKAYGCISVGMQGKELTDMGRMIEAGAVGFTDDGLPVMDANLMRRAFEYSSMFNVPIAQHAEDLNLSQGGAINEGRVSFELGIKGIPTISESVIVARDILLLKYVENARYHVLHVSVKEALDAVRWGKTMGLNVTCEVAPHHFLLTEEEVIKHGSMAKMNPPLRTEEDRLALIEGLKDGTVDAIATDHAPHEKRVKECSIEDAAFGIVGVETLLPLSLELYHIYGMDLIDVFAKLTFKPADIINLDLGRIQKNKKADLIIIDIDYEYKIDANKFISKSKNTPFSGRRVKGIVERTIVAGETVYKLIKE